MRLTLVILAGFALTATAGSCGYIEKSVESPAVGGGEVVFRYPSHSARTVQVAGDWNNWGAGDAAQGEVLVGLMKKNEKGVWTVSRNLPPGRYRYYFILNETQRILDPANPRVVDDPWGGKASLLIVP
jgi:1,4-alpha-glucan branching enzyme